MLECFKFRNRSQFVTSSSPLIKRLWSTVVVCCRLLSGKLLGMKWMFLEANLS